MPHLKGMLVLWGDSHCVSVALCHLACVQGSQANCNLQYCKNGKTVTVFTCGSTVLPACTPVCRKMLPDPACGLPHLDQHALELVLSSKLHRHACDSCYQGHSLTLILSRSLTPSATVAALLPLVLSPRELMPLLVGGPLCVCQAKQDPSSNLVI